MAEAGEGSTRAIWAALGFNLLIAAIAIGVLLTSGAVLIARDGKGLLIGESVAVALEREILRPAVAHPAVKRAEAPLPIHLAPTQVAAALRLDFHDDIRASEVEVAAVAIDAEVRGADPEVVPLFFRNWPKP